MKPKLNHSTAAKPATDPHAHVGANPQKLLGFQTAAKIVRYYGYKPEKIS